jgi:uncharacterized membrane protein
MFNPAHFHPMLVHFPIALILAGILADIAFMVCKKEICFSKAGLYLMILGTIGALAAFLTGEFLTSHPEEGEIMSVFEKHETGAWVTLIVMVIGSALRIYLVSAKKEQSPFKWAVFALFIAGAAAVTYTGFFGGSMVYEFMVGL